MSSSSTGNSSFGGISNSISLKQLSCETISSVNVNGNSSIEGTPNEIDVSSNMISLSPTCEMPGTLSCTNQVTINGVGSGLTVLPNDTPSVNGQVLTTTDTDGSVSWSNSTSVRIGANAGTTGGGNNVVAIGYQAAQIDQHPFSIAIGNQAGRDTQQDYAIAIGTSCGNSNQEAHAIAIGNTAAYTSQGTYAIAIGAFAGQASQGAHSIVLNATGSTLNSAGASTCVIAPIANTSSATRTLMYNESNGELQWLTGSTAKTFVIDHPIKEDSYLVHACLEGPEMGVYYRGTSQIAPNQCMVRIDLPLYLSKLAYDFTVQCTQHVDDDMQTSFTPSYIAVSPVKITEHDDCVYFNVYALANTVFHWTVLAKRKGELEIEPLKESVALHGNGTPYTFVTRV